MHTFTYTNKLTQKILLVCNADGISEADEMLLEQTGIKAIKASYVGCSIKFNQPVSGEE